MKVISRFKFCTYTSRTKFLRQNSRHFTELRKFDDILTYFFSIYIEGGASRNPLYSHPHLESFRYGVREIPQNSYCCEGYHSALNPLFHCSHPSVWLLFDGLIRDAACQRLIVANMGPFPRYVPMATFKKFDPSWDFFTNTWEFSVIIHSG